jgi:hypothetical protein
VGGEILRKGRRTEQEIIRMEGGTRMRQKQFVFIYGKVVQPVLKGMSAKYFSNGTWKETARVRRVVEVTEEHIKFETDRIRYCIEFRKDEAGALLAAA